MPSPSAVLPTPSKSSALTQLPSCPQSASINPLDATLADSLATAANKRLTPTASLVDATLTKNRGGAASFARSERLGVGALLTFQRLNIPTCNDPRSNSFILTSLAAPHPLTPNESHPYKNHRGEGCGPFSAPATKFQPPLCFHSLTNCPFSIPFFLIFIHVMGGTPLPVFQGANAPAGRKPGHSAGEGRTTMNFQTYLRVGARERTRTSTTLRSLRPERSASANSATRARVRIHPNRVGLNPEMVDPSRAGITHTTRLFHCARRPHPLSTRRDYLNSRLRLRGKRAHKVQRPLGIAHAFLQSARVEI